jgi:hypothetical protein
MNEHEILVVEIDSVDMWLRVKLSMSQAKNSV